MSIYLNCLENCKQNYQGINRIFFKINMADKYNHYKVQIIYFIFR